MKNINVILADSNFDNAQKLMITLKQIGIKQVIHATNNESLIKFIKANEAIDLLILDSNLSNLKLINFIEIYLRNNKKIINRILTTTITKIDYLNFFYKNGIDFIVNHPVSSNEIKTILNIVNKVNICDNPEKLYSAESIKVLKDNINSMFNKIKLKKDLLGYQYLLTAVELVYKDYRIGQAATKWLYPEIATIHQTSYIRVERAIRNCISECVKTTSHNSLVNTANLITRSNNTISNLEFIFGIVETLKNKP